MQHVCLLCPGVLLAMAFVGPLQNMRGTKRKAACVLCQVDDSSGEDVWDNEKETFRVYEARVNTPLPGEPKQSWPLSDFHKSSQDHCCCSDVDENVRCQLAF